MAKTLCIYFAQDKCNRGDICYYKHEDKAAAATKDSPKRTNSPAPMKDKKGKESNAAPCLIHRCQKFACIAKTKPKATSSQVSSEPVSMKRIRFRKSVHFIEVPAVGQQRPVRNRPREYSCVYRPADLVSKGMLRDVNAKNCRPAEHPISLITANGSCLLVEWWSWWPGRNTFSTFPVRVHFCQ